MKNISILLAILFFGIAANAQNVSMTGNLNELKGKNIQFVFDYSEAEVGRKKTPEAQFIEEKVAKLNEKEAGKGEKWQAAWEEDKPSRHEPKFIKLATDNCDKAIFGTDNGHYIATVKITFLEPGYNIGISRSDALVSMEVSFASASDPGKVIGTITVLKATGKIIGGYDFDNGGRITEAYAKAGKSFAKFFCKKVK